MTANSRRIGALSLPNWSGVNFATIRRQSAACSSVRSLGGSSLGDGMAVATPLVLLLNIGMKRKILQNSLFFKGF
jgi:hypothetical protein